MNILLKLKETVSSVLPVMLIVLLLGVTIAPLGGALIVRFLTGGVLVIIGLTVFLLGIDIGVIPIGERSGAALAAKRNLPLLLAAAFAIGFIVTVAEPDVQVLADQVQGIAPEVGKWSLILSIAAGIGLFVALGILRTVLSLPLNVLLLVAYALVFLLAFCTPATFQGIAFDTGGATTGPMTVPFIMALGMGVAAVRAKEDKKSGKIATSSDESFGLTGIASIGPIAAVALYGIILAHASAGGGALAAGAGAANAAVGGEETGVSAEIVAGADVRVGVAVAELTAGTELAAGVSSTAGAGTGARADEPAAAVGISVFLHLLPEVAGEVVHALLPLVGMACVFQLTLLRLPPFQVIRMVRGFVFSFIGLVIFLTGANGGFMPAGQQLGEVLGSLAAASSAWTALLVAIGFVFGAVVVIAEPAVWVLTDQVESVSGGTIKRRVMLGALSLGVAFSIGLSMLRVLTGFSLMCVLIPGYALSLALAFISPKLFTGIAFDSGGVASGTMTSTFILSFTLGASTASGGNPAADAFGVIALVAMTPLIAIQVLGVLFKIKTEKAAHAKEVSAMQSVHAKAASAQAPAYVSAQAPLPAQARAPAHVQAPAHAESAQGEKV